MAESEKEASPIEDGKTNAPNSDIKSDSQSEPPIGDAQPGITSDKEKVVSEQIAAPITQQPDEEKKPGTNGDKITPATVDEGKKNETNIESKPSVPVDKGKVHGTDGEKRPSVTVDEVKKPGPDGEKKLSVTIDIAKRPDTDGEKSPSADEGKNSGAEGEQRPTVTVSERKKSVSGGEKRSSMVKGNERKKSGTERQSILKSDFSYSLKFNEIEGEKRKSILLQDGERRKSSADFRKSFLSASKLTFGQKSLSRLKVRRTTYGFGSVSGIRPVEKYQVPIEFRRPPMIYLNTYQLEPRKRFNPASVENTVNEALDEMFNGHKYNSQNSPAVALDIAGIIMRKVKYMEFHRYRIMALVVIGQKRAQSYNNTITFLWDADRDDYVDIERQEHSCFIQVTVFGVYLD